LPRIARRIRKQSTATETLDICTEMAAAGMLFGLLPALPEWHTSRFWAGIGRRYGERINSKLAEAMPGCRAGWRYAVGEFPPVPLIKPLPANHLGHREQIVIDGTTHWYVGQPWQKCQAQHLKDLGEIDGREWQAYLAWRRAGYRSGYVLDEDMTGQPIGCIAHLCW
jgi:hypothetical protein